MRRLVSLLAAYTAGGTARMGMHDEAVLVGGCSQMPGMGGGALGSAMKRRIIAADDPAMSNAVGFEAKASSTVAGLAGGSSPKRVLELPLHLALGRLVVLRGGFLSGFRLIGVWRGRGKILSGIRGIPYRVRGDGHGARLLGNAPNLLLHMTPGRDVRMLKDEYHVIYGGRGGLSYLVPQACAPLCRKGQGKQDRPYGFE